MADQLFQIKHRFSGKSLFELKCGSLKLCVEAAVKANTSLDGASLVGASLDGASLVGASLVGASLVGASLDEASLDGASLVGASLVGASLVGASLDGAFLDGAFLAGASLDGASLVRASLVRASLVRASLVRASLDEASLDGASLLGASLDGASLVGADGKKTTIQKEPIQISGLRWHIIIFDKDMRIGCEYHSLADWWAYDDAKISDMDRDALGFWRQNNAMLQGVCAATGRLVGRCGGVQWVSAETRRQNLQS
jgi:hypothetical protein